MEFSAAVRLSLAHILKQVHWWAVSIITIYDVVSRMWSSHFKPRYTFFQFLSTIIVNLVHTIVQSAYLYVIFHVKHKRYHFSRFFTWFPILGKIQDGAKMANIIGGVTGLQHGLEIYLASLRRSKVFDWRQNRFEILQHIKNSGKGFHPTPPPPLLYQGGGMNLRVRPRVKSCEDGNGN